MFEHFSTFENIYHFENLRLSNTIYHLHFFVKLSHVEKPESMGNVFYSAGNSKN